MITIKEVASYFLWAISGKKTPAPGNVKRYILKKYALKYKLRHFVETGTFNGDTVAAMAPYFDTVESVELSQALYKKAVQRFKNYRNVKIWHGDSGEILNKIIRSARIPILFWLDAHGSGGVTAEGREWSPVLNELISITKKSKYKHIILIDDARGFTGHLSPTIQQIEEAIKKNHTNYLFKVKDDIIRIVLK